MTGIDWRTVFAFIGGATTLLAPVGIAIAWFGRTYIDRWLSKRFQGELEALKHAQAREIESMKARAAETLDRTIKLHASEFEILPQTWGLLSSGISLVQDSLTVYFTPKTVHEIEDRHLRNIMGMDTYSTEDIDLVLSHQGDARDAAYQDVRVRMVARKALEAYAAFTNYYLSKSILIDTELLALLGEMTSAMGRAVNHDLTEAQKYESIPHYMAAKQASYVEDATRLRDEIRARMFARLTDSREPRLVQAEAK